MTNNKDNNKLVMGKIEQLTTTDQVNQNSLLTNKKVVYSISISDKTNLTTVDLSKRKTVLGTNNLLSKDELKIKRLKDKCLKLRTRSLAANKMVKELCWENHKQRTEIKLLKQEVEFYKKKLATDSVYQDKYNNLIKDLANLSKNKKVDVIEL